MENGDKLPAYPENPTTKRTDGLINCLFQQLGAQSVRLWRDLLATSPEQETKTNTIWSTNNQAQ